MKDSEMVLTLSSFSSISSPGKKKGRNAGEGDWDEDPVKETATIIGHIGEHIREM